MKTVRIGIWAGLLVAVLVTPASAERVGYRVEVDRSVLPAGTSETAVVKVTLTAQEAPPEQERTPVNLAIVLDRSGSMSGSKIDYARQAAIEAIRHLHPGDVVSLVTYDSQIETVIPAQHPRDVEWMVEQVKRITPRGMTALFGGVSQGAAELRKHQDGHFTHRMILLSDGIANVGPSQPDDLARLGASLLKEQIQVSTVGVGLDYNEDLMTSLASQSGGNTYFVEDSADLPRILTAELGEAQQLVARQTVIEITLPEGVEAIRIIGREGRVSGSKVVVPLHHLQGGQSRYALIEVRVPARAPQAELELAQVSIAYDDLATQRRVTSGLQGVSVTFSEDMPSVIASINEEVEVEYLRNTLALAKDEAIRLADEGRKEEAAEALRGVARDYQQVAARAGNDELLREAEDIDQTAEVLGRDGLDNRDRKAFREYNHNVINQQQLILQEEKKE